MKALPRLLLLFEDQSGDPVHDSLNSQLHRCLMDIDCSEMYKARINFCTMIHECCPRKHEVRFVTCEVEASIFCWLTMLPWISILLQISGHRVNSYMPKNLGATLEVC